MQFSKENKSWTMGMLYDILVIVHSDEPNRRHKKLKAPPNHQSHRMSDGIYISRNDIFSMASISTVIIV